jgi:hypothetical protein
MANLATRKIVRFDRITSRGSAWPSELSPQYPCEWKRTLAESGCVLTAGLSRPMRLHMLEITLETSRLEVT